MKKILSILMLLIVIFLCSCSIIDNTTSLKTYTLTYTTIGNGKINCIYESGSTHEDGTCIYLLAISQEGENLINWTVNGNDYGSKSGIVVSLTDNQNVVATFSSNTKEIEETYDSNTIYASLPNDWENVTLIVYKTWLTNNEYKMKQNDSGIWYYNFESIEMNSILSVSFKEDNHQSITYTFDKEHNFFNAIDYDFNGFLYGGFTTYKTDSLMKLSILELNDLHGYIVQSEDGKSGMSNVSYLINQIRNEDKIENTVLVANGDMFQGTALSNLTHGLSVLKCMNEMKFDFMGVGNHEFDWGLEYVTQYFDGKEENGEANFPLIASNIKDNNTNKLLKNENILQTYLMEKTGIKIGVISLIDDLESSILYSKVKDYTFLGTTLCKDQAIELKKQGADIIIVNIHGGDSDGITSFDMNQTLASLEYNGEWLINCVINGHTHSAQNGVIERAGQDLPIVQGGSYCYYLGQIELFIDLNKKEVVSSRNLYTSTYDIGINYDKAVEKIISEEYKKVQPQMEEVYCTSAITISKRSTLYKWAANVIYTSTGCICGISNTAGIRSTGNIKAKGAIKLENVYLINPFDNEIVIAKITGKQLYKFLSKNKSVYYEFKEGYSLDSLKNDTKKYDVAVIDYVYFWDEFPKSKQDIFTSLILRECMIEDLKLRNTFDPESDYEARIGKLYK